MVSMDITWYNYLSVSMYIYHEAYDLLEDHLWHNDQVILGSAQAGDHDPAHVWDMFIGF